MNTRKKILFKIKDEVVLEETRDLFLNQIDELIWQIARECEVKYEDVDIEVVDVEPNLSEDIDVTAVGLVFWKDLYHHEIQGVSCVLDEGSDEYLDAINNGTIEDYLLFYI